MKYFTLRELKASQKATQLNIDNSATFTAKHIIDRNLIILVNRVLDPAREKLCGPIIVNSGYRCQVLNDTLAGSSSNSMHMLGRAADIRPMDSNRLDELYTILENLPHTELIKYTNFIHVSL